jgi:hypothetical protein
MQSFSQNQMAKSYQKGMGVIKKMGSANEDFGNLPVNCWSGWHIVFAEY